MLETSFCPALRSLWGLRRGQNTSRKVGQPLPAALLGLGRTLKGLQPAKTQGKLLSPAACPSASVPHHGSQFSCYLQHFSWICCSFLLSSADVPEPPS